MKKHVYLFNEGSRAAVYGIGTYIRQMITCLTSIKDLFLHVVQLNSDVEYFEIIKHESGYEEINIPSPLFTIREQQDRYYRNCWYLIRSNMHIKKEESVYFFLNYTNHRLMISEMRKTFPSCHIYFTIHYQNWCFSLNGDVNQIKKLLKKNKYELSSQEQIILNSFHEEEQTYELVDRVICLSHFTENLLWHLYKISPNKIEVIYNGLKDEVVYNSTTVRNNLKRQLGFSNKEKIILYVGRLDPIKGIKLLIRSFISLVSEKKDCRLVLIGDGNFSTYLKECNGYWNQITFTGRLEKDQLYQFYQIADIGILPSMHEQCSYTAIEMMMFGIPLIASTTTGLKEMIREDKSDYLFDMQSEEDEEAQKTLIYLMANLLLESPNKRKESVQMNFKKNYTIKIMSNKYRQLFLRKY